MQQKKSFRPQELRNLLGFILFVLIAGGVGIFYLGFEQLKTYSAEVSQELQAARSSEARAEQQQSLKIALEDSQNLIATADALFSTPDSYTPQLTSDITAHASAAGINATVTPEDASSGSYILSVAINGPTDYSSFIKFLDGIETNIPKMDVVGLIINRVESDQSKISVSNMKIKAAVR